MKERLSKYPCLMLVQWHMMGNTRGQLIWSALQFFLASEICFAILRAAYVVRVVPWQESYRAVFH